ncbi:uncharacterized protein LOC114970166 isoform X3 [Acropora millepora]|uniref:uncharacterized protein LOC114970166 isoform X3 n=1 Tax=Acropora millepora TaxID=45264 RepID=UPI001CF2F293|nr:uncharacterized protein LOC114970166 isoform X3 [Acropora millepora]
MNDIVAKIIVIKRNGTDGPQFPLRSDKCLFGRKPDCDIRIQLPNVSQEHAVVEVEDDKKIHITNLSSCSQTLVNGKPVSEVEIHHLDILTISDRSFRFELPLSKAKQANSLKVQNFQSSPLATTPQGKRLSKMPTPKGSPRTPPTGGTLKENISTIHRHSEPLQEEEEEGLVSPANIKRPFSLFDVNVHVDANEGSAARKADNKRESGEVNTTRGQSKRVSFGPILSPEQFDKDLPPATPVRRGATPKRSSLGFDNSCVTSSLNSKKRRSVSVLPHTDPIKEEELDDKDTLKDTESIKGLKEGELNEEGSLEETEPIKGLNEEESKGNETCKDVTPNKSKASEVNQELQEIKHVPEICAISQNSDHGEIQGFTYQMKTPTECRRSSLRLARKNHSFPEEQTAVESDSCTDNVEEMDGTILDSDDYTSEEDENDRDELPIDESNESANIEEQAVEKRIAVSLEREMKMNTPLKKEIVHGIQLRQTQKRMATPLRKEISEGLKLRQTKKRMATPLQKEITGGTQLRQTKKRMATPLKREIANGLELRQTKKRMATPLKKEIANGLELKQTKMKMTTPLKKEIEDGLELRQTKKRMATPLKKEIANGLELKQTKKRMATPLKKEIEDGLELRQTKKRMATPLKKEIANGLELKQTKKNMATPLKKEIEDGLELRQTKKRMATPLKKEIANGLELKQTKMKMATPLKKEIEDGLELRQTKKRMATPLKKEIAGGTRLRQTKKRLATPLRKEIADGIQLKETKKKMATPLREELAKGIQLTKVHKKLKTPIRKEIENGFTLRSTKKKLPSPLQKDIQAGPKLRETRKKLSTPVRKEIESKPRLRQTTKTMNSQLQEEIKLGVQLRKTREIMASELQIDIEGKKLKSSKRRLSKSAKKVVDNDESVRGTTKSLPTPIKMQIENGVALKNKETLKRKRGEEEAPPTTQAKKMKLSLSDEKNNGIRRALNTPLKRAIAMRPKSRPTRHRLASSFREQIHSKPTLRSVRRKSSSATTKQNIKRPTYAEIVKRAKKTCVMKASPKTKPIAAEITDVPPKPAQGTPRNDVNPTESLNSTRTTRSRRSTWMSSLALAVNGSKSRKVHVEDLQGVPELFQTPPVVHLPTETSAKKQKTGNWLSSLAKATRGRRKRGSQVTDFVGISDLFLTPPCVPGVKESKPTEDKAITESPYFEVPPMTEDVAPTFTPSLSKAGKDTRNVGEATPAKTTPQEKLQVVQPLAISKTPSLRYSEDDAVSVQIVSPVQVSRTPSLRSAANQSSVLSDQSPETQQMQFLPSVEPNKTPSLPSTESVQSVLRKSDEFPSDSRKLPDPQEMKHLMKSQEHNDVEKSEDFFVPNMFTSPKPQPKRYSRKSEGLQGLARLLGTPQDRKKEKNNVSPKLNGIKEMFKATTLTSPNFVGIRALMKTPKVSKQVDPEEHFNTELFAADEEDRSLQSDDLSDAVPIEVIIIDSTPEKNEENETKQETSMRITRAKRSASNDLTEPVSKRSRRTRSATTLDDFSNDVCSGTKPEQKKTSRQKRKPTPVAPTTPKPFVFKRTQLDPIVEVPSPVPSFCISSSQKDQNEMQITSAFNGKHETSPLQSPFPDNDSNQTESLSEAITEEAPKSPFDKRRKTKTRKTPVKTRLTRSNRGSEASSQPCETKENDETVADIPLRRSRRRTNVVKDDKPVSRGGKSRRNTSLSDNFEKSEDVKHSRKTRSRVTEVTFEEESKQTQRKSGDLEKGKSSQTSITEDSDSTTTRRMTRSRRDKTPSSEKGEITNQEISALEETKEIQGKPAKIISNKPDPSNSKGEKDAMDGARRQRDTRKTRSISQIEKIAAEERATNRLEECADSSRKTRSKKNSSTSTPKTPNANNDNATSSHSRDIEPENFKVREPSKGQMKGKDAVQPQGKTAKRNSKEAEFAEVTKIETRGTKRKRQDDSNTTVHQEPKRMTRSSARIQNKSGSRK